ncbi:hypothetical protein ACEPAG_3345 [Sanghuangporus baumii]
MYSTRRFASDRDHSRDASNAFQDETRHLEHRRRHHRRYDDNEYYGAEDQYGHSSWAGHSEYYDRRDRTYYRTFDRTYENTQHYDEYRHREEHFDRVGDASNYEPHLHRRSYNETKMYLAGPSLSNIPRRSLSATPPPQPIPSAPSPEYLKIASEPSEKVPTPPRKLIILDLNGTLLLRIRSLGTIYPRSYMPAFRDYLLCPATRQWLDVMVWSSAQPHNVDRMVRRCFFDARLGPLSGEPDGEEADERSEVEENEDDKWHGKLVAVWARDTLGLSRSDYSRKAQTTKDLEKPWSAIPGDHSAQTTVLLDDSPRKARLQPFNHVCINEYSLERRDSDKALKRRQRRYEEREKKVEDLPVADITDAKLENKSALEERDGHAGEELKENEKARKKKKEEKKKKRQEVLDAMEEKDSQLNEMSEYDSALLAIIGILDALKHESNVAGWIRAGGLWASKTPPSLDSSTKEDVSAVNGERAPSPTDLEVNGEKEDVEQRPQRPVSPSMAKRQRSLGFEVLGTSGGDSKRTRFNASGVVPELDEPIAAGNDAETVEVAVDGHEPSIHHSENGVEAKPSHSVHEETRAKMWFEDEETFRTWVQRGRRALKQLGIEERDGISID